MAIKCLLKKTEPKYVNFDIDSWNNGGPAIVSYNRGQVLIFKLQYGGEMGGIMFTEQIHKQTLTCVNVY